MNAARPWLLLTHANRQRSHGVSSGVVIEKLAGPVREETFSSSVCCVTLPTYFLIYFLFWNLICVTLVVSFPVSGCFQLFALSCVFLTSCVFVYLKSSPQQFVLTSCALFLWSVFVLVISPASVFPTSGSALGNRKLFKFLLAPTELRPDCLKHGSAWCVLPGSAAFTPAFER